MTIWNDALIVKQLGHVDLHNRLARRNKQAVYACEYEGVDRTGAADSTDGLQSALAAAAGKQLIISPGEYLINPDYTAGGSLIPASNTTLVFMPGAVLKATPNALDKYALIRLVNVSHVSIVGGELRGERDQHIGETGYGGHGMDIRGCTDIRISGTVCRDGWGDGIYLTASQRVTLEDVRCIHNRRDGLSLTSGQDITIRGSQFTDNGGVLPGAGIQIEPNPDQLITDIMITDCVASGNHAGIQIDSSWLRLARIQITNCAARNNTLNGLSVGYVDDLLVSGIQSHSNKQDGFMFRFLADAQISNIVSFASGRFGVYFPGDCTDTLVNGAIIRRAGIEAIHTDTDVITPTLLNVI